MKVPAVMVMLAMLLLPAGAMIERAVAEPAGASVAPAQDIAYGADPLQHIDFWAARKPGTDVPLVVFVHGGGWKRGDKRNATGSAKVGHYLSAGYAFASVNYRLVPENSVEQQAQDVADAVATLITRARTLGFSPRKVVLMGHSAGAHLVALVGTDMRYLKAAGLGADSIAGIVPIDGAGYDVPRQMAQAGSFMRATYSQAFGEDAQRQRALSPTLQASEPNAPAFLILHVQRIDGAAQAKALGEALRAAGTPAQVEGFPGTGLRGHMEINRSLGDPAYPATPVVGAWLKKVFAAR